MRKLISIVVCFCLVICFFLGNTIEANADPFTAVQIGAASYAAMSSWGISFTSGNATATGMGDFMAQQVEDYVNYKGGTIASVFGSELAINAAGKMAAGYQMYNSFIEFKDWLIEKYSLDDSDQKMTSGYYNGTWLDQVSEVSSVSELGFSVEFTSYEQPTTSEPFGGYRTYQAYSNGETYGRSRNADTAYRFLGQWYLTAVESGDNYAIRNVTPEVNKRTGSLFNYFIAVASIPKSSLGNSLSWNGSDYVVPSVIDPSYEWLGQIGDYQDINLEQLLNHVLDDVEDNNLVVEGEVSPVDPPQPTPTPMPIEPDTPLQDVPWEGLDTNLQNLYNQGLEEIGAIGDAQDAITDAVADQTGALEGAIADNAGVVSGAIDQAVSDIQDAISEQTQTLSESASATAEATESIAEALEDEAINWQKFDLRGLFPFCIPFDIYNMLEALDASPTAPHVQLPFVIESIGFSYTIDLDFSAFDTVAAVMRQMELIVYGIALAWATSKVIKW